MTIYIVGSLSKFHQLPIVSQLTTIAKLQDGLFDRYAFERRHKPFPLPFFSECSTVWSLTTNKNIGGSTLGSI